MWVRIDELVFESACTEAVVDRVRNTAVSKHDGEGFRGFRLLVDAGSGHALDVSYWDTEVAALMSGVDPDPTAMTQVVRSNVYEMRIDSV